MSYLFPATRITFEAALRDVAQATPKGRAAAAHALGEPPDDAAGRRRAIDALVRALDDDTFEVRAEACASLGGIGDPSAVDAIAKRLADGSAAVRQNAAIALGSIRDAGGFAPLADALATGPAELRYQAVTSLAEIDPARAYGPALTALADRDPQVSGAAALALGAIGDARAVPALAARYDDTTDAAARFDLAYALAELHDAHARTTLVSALTDEDRAWDAVTGLAWLGAPDDLAALAGCLRAKKTPIEASVLAAGRLLAAGPAAEPQAEAARALLLEALANRKMHVRGIAVDQLAEVGGAWALPALEKLARHRHADELGEGLPAAIAAIAQRETRA